LVAFSAFALSCSDDTTTKPDSALPDIGVDAVVVDTTSVDTSMPDMPPPDKSLVDTVSIRFSQQVQPLFTAKCATSSCHAGTSPAKGLNLESGKAYNALVGATSKQCSTMPLVTGGDIYKSYILQKLSGNGTCFTGQQMPPPGPLTSANFKIISDWVKEGAHNN